MQIVGITHRTSRAGDPHRHIHMQVGTRVWAAGKWRGLDTAAIFRQQGVIRALGTAVIAAHPELAEVLDRHCLTLDPATGEVVELQPFNALMSKRGEQVRRNFERLEAEWQATHPGESMGPVVSSRLTAQAWAHDRPAKKPTTLREEEAWLTELRDAGYDPETLRRPAPSVPVSLDELSVQRIASRALDRCAAAASAWTRHSAQEQATRIITEARVRATGAELRELITVATRLALEDCFSVLPPDAATPEHVAHLTSLRVVQAETKLRDLLTARTSDREPNHPNVQAAAQARGFDVGQERAAAALASTDPLVIVEGAAGAGKTTMLGVAIEVAAQHRRASRMVAPTLRAAQVAQEELGVPATSVAALVHAHGWRWNADGVWSRLVVGDIDPDTGRAYIGVPKAARLARGERVIVDEAGMLNQDTAIALLTVCDEAGASVALVGDRAQLAAVGRGGVFDMAAHIRGRTFDMAEVHRFIDPAYADLTLQIRDGTNPGQVFDRLASLGLVRLHASSDEVRGHIAQQRNDGDAVTVASNDEAARINDRIRDERIGLGLVDDTATAVGSDGLGIGRGDLIQTRKNDTALGVTNRQQWIVQHVTDDGTVTAREASSGRKVPRTVRLPADYVAEHTHLSYAATAYGVQGATTDRSHTILTDSTSAASVYVGMTRGRNENLLHIVADSQTEPRAQFVAAMQRDRADRGLADAPQRTVEEVAGLAADGPVKLVNDEIATLMTQKQDAEQRAERLTRMAQRLDAQTWQHRAEAADSTLALEAARERLERSRGMVRPPILALVQVDAQSHEEATARQIRAAERVRKASQFGKPKARKVHRIAAHNANMVRARLNELWGSTPTWSEPAEIWAARVADCAVEDSAEVKDATLALRSAELQQKEMSSRHEAECRALLRKLYGAEQVRRDPTRYEFARPRREAQEWARIAEEASAEIAALRALPPEQAATQIEVKRAVAEAAREAQEQERAARKEQMRGSFKVRRNGAERGGPMLGI